MANKTRANSIGLLAGGALPAVLAMLAATAAAVAPPADTIELGPRYRDVVHGFSLCPPLGTQRIRVTSASQLVSWVRRDEDAGAIAWTLAVQWAVERKEVPDLRGYAESLAKKLRGEERFNVDSVRVVQVAGRPAIFLQGQSGGAVRLWQRQVWIQAQPAAAGEPTRFLILVMTGPLNLEQEMQAVMDKVVATLELVDLRSNRAIRRANLERGAKLLSSLDEAKLTAAVQTQPQWFLWRLEDEDIGFMRVQEAAAQRAGLNGIEVTTWLMMEPPGEEVRLAKRVMFSTAGTVLEHWQEQIQVGVGPNAPVVVERGMMTNGAKIVCDVVRNGQATTAKKNLPAAVTPIYLSRAQGMLLGRLVDLTTPGGYAFASYTSAANDFDMRTFTVVGPEKITMQGSRLEAIRASEQLAADAQEAALWLDARGRVLRMQTPNQLTLEKATKQAVLRKFPNADGIVRGMAKWARNRN